jgi:hypothetical protein
VNEEALARWGLSRQKHTSYNFCVNKELYFSVEGVTRSTGKMQQIA